MAITTRISTADELLRLPRGRDRHELIAGELVTMAPSGSDHAWVASAFAGPLIQFVMAHGLGRVFIAEGGFLLSARPDTVRVPDVGFVRQERVLAVGRPQGYWPGAPDLVVEVVSPHDRASEVREKVATWLAAGARMVVVINPRRRTVAVHRPGLPVRMLSEEDAFDGEDVVPGWTFPIRSLFV